MTDAQAPTRDNLRAVMAALPAGIPYVHHGRDRAGLDCIGLVFLVFREVGLSIDHLDVPYSELDAHRPHRFRVILTQLDKAFDRLHPADGLVDGDVVLVRNDGRDANHLGVYCDGRVWHMSGRSLRPLPLYRVRAHVAATFRHRELTECPSQSPSSSRPWSAASPPPPPPSSPAPRSVGRPCWSPPPSAPGSAPCP